MGEFFQQFFAFLIFSPLLAAVFGVGIWILPAVFLRGQLDRMRLSLFHFFVASYVFVAISALYLLIVGTKLSAADGGGRHHQVGPIVGMLVSLTLSWWIHRALRKRFPRAPRPGGPPGPTYQGVGHPGYGQRPGYPPGLPGYPPPAGYPGQPVPPPQPGQPLQPAPQPRPRGEVTDGDPRRPAGTPWAVPPPGQALPPAPPGD